MAGKKAGKGKLGEAKRKIQATWKLQKKD